MCDCEVPEIYTETWPRARKEYQCEECFRPIRKGATYFKFEGKYYSGFESYRRHERCHRICQALEKGADCCMPFGEMKEWLGEHCESNRRRRRISRGEQLRAEYDEDRRED